MMIPSCLPIPLALSSSNDLYEVMREDGLVASCKDSLGIPATSTLDLGCGLEPTNPIRAAMVHGVDIGGLDRSNIHTSDLFSDVVPYRNEHFSYVSDNDLIMNVPFTVLGQGLTHF